MDNVTAKQTVDRLLKVAVTDTGGAKRVAHFLVAVERLRLPR
jgi:hypothetical protein